MSRRPMCQMLAVLLFVIAVLQYLGLSWLWKSPAGTLPMELAEKKENASVTGIVYQQEEKTYQNITYTYLYIKDTILYINSKEYPMRHMKCTIEQSLQENFIGSKILLQGTLEMPATNTNPGEFNQRAWESSRKIDFYLTDSLKPEVLTEPSVWMQKIEWLRERGKEIFIEIFPETEAGILEAMILGEKSLLETETKEEFQAAGISHILAISGLHMSLIGMGIFMLCRWVRLPLWSGILVSVAILLGYGLLLGNPTTAFRALLMFVIAMSAKILGRSYDLLSALAAAGIVLLLDNPDLVSDSGFCLSFAAVFGMGCYCNNEETTFRQFCDTKGKAGTSLRSGISLWFFSLPIVLFFFYQVSVAGILVNLFVIPLMPVVLGSGLCALFVGAVHIGWGSIAAIPCYFLLRIYEHLGAFVQSSSFGMWTPGKPEFWQIIGYYLLLFFASYAMRALKVEKHGRLLWFGIQIGVKLLLILVITAPWNLPQKMTVLDVGQGDGIVLQMDGRSILVDGGSSGRKNIGKNVLIPYLKSEGIACLDMILVTHSDADHMNGVLEVLQESQKGWFQVRALGMPGWMQGQKAGNDLEELARQSKTEIIWLEKGDEIVFGSSLLRILHPDDTDFSLDVNAGSLVFLWETAFGNGLFMGDLPLEQETQLISELAPCYFLKVGHHGSNGSTSEELLNCSRPQLAFISCGENNRYGHPGEELVMRLQKADCEICRTDQQGAWTLLLRERKKKAYKKAEKYFTFAQSQTDGYT